MYCGHYYSNTNNMSKHIKMSHAELFQCDFSSKPKQCCSKFFFTFSEKEEHVLQVHKTARVIFGSEVKCVYCGKICRDIKLLRKHVNNYHAGIGITCRFRGCGLYFLKETERDEHFYQAHQQTESLKIFKCHYCSYKSAGKSDLILHIKRRHINNDALVQCHKCPRYFKSDLNLKEHLRHFHGERFFCEFCMKHLQKISVRLHLQKSVCMICNLELPCVNVLKSHLKICRQPNV